MKISDSTIFGTVVAICFIIGFMAGMSFENKAWEGLLVKTGHAQYCPDTGDWNWKDACKKD